MAIKYPPAYIRISKRFRDWPQGPKGSRYQNAPPNRQSILDPLMYDMICKKIN